MANINNIFEKQKKLSKLLTEAGNSIEEDAVFHFLTECLRNEADDICGIFSNLTAQQSYVLLNFSEKMAALTVREPNSDRSFVGLFVLEILTCKIQIDIREIYLILSLHFHALKKINCSVTDIVNRLPKISDVKGVRINLAEAFLSRSLTDQSIEAMGYEESFLNGEFIFRRKW